MRTRRYSDRFAYMGDDYYRNNPAKWYRFAPAWNAIQTQDILHELDYQFNPIAVTQTLKWWDQAIRFGFIDC